jgi:hypothetical protein
MGTGGGGIVTEQRLRELYAAAVSDRTLGPETGHPEPEAIAALVHREGPEEPRLAILDHVMACAECQREFDLLRAVERAGMESGVREGPRSRPAWLMPAALAASLLLAIGVGRTLLRTGDETTRGAGDADAVTLFQPGPSSVVGDSLAFVWSAVPGARRYELELLDSGGAVAASATTADTTASPPAVRALPPGDYRWWVRATTSDARALRSSLRPLRLIAR